MTAKDKLHQVVDDLSELEAERMLDDHRPPPRARPMIAAFKDAPEVDEPLTPEERASLDEAWAQRGDSVPLDEFLREFD